MLIICTADGVFGCYPGLTIRQRWRLLRMDSFTPKRSALGREGTPKGASKRAYRIS